MNIPLERIAPADYARELSELTVESLMHSIERLGLLQPIIVMQAKINRGVLCDGWRIVAGHHRFEACRRLGMSEIDATVMPNVSYLETELIEIDENLCRAELTAAQRAAAIKRRKQIWEALNPETGGTNCPTSLADGRKAGPQHLQQFAADTANTTGESKRDINRHLARADALGDDLQAVSGTSLDKGVELDALKTLPANERQALIARARKGEAVSARKATAHLRLTIEYRDVHDGAVSLARSIMKRDRDLALALRDVLDTQLMEAL
jgi:hypothetical protein